MSDRIRFRFEGPFQPYTRMTQRSKWTGRAQSYLSSQNALRTKARLQMSRLGIGTLPESTPLAVAIEIEMSGRLHCQDIDNQAKGIIDALQGEVFKNDCWIDDLWVTRRLGDSDLQTVEFCVLKP